MKKRNLIFGCLVIVTVLLGTACAAKPQPTPTVDPGVVMTEVAETVSAEMTRIALMTPSPTPTLEATPTLPVTPTIAMTVPASSVSTSTPPGAANLPAVATQPVTTSDAAEWVADVTVPDGTQFYLKETFTKIWKVKNTGVTTWNSSYSLVNIDENTWGAKSVIPLTTTVAPGQQVELKVTLRAPNSFGKQFSRWFLMNPNGQLFGTELYVYIDVNPKAIKTATPAG